MLHILRLGHRFGRDERISTHCGLVARVLGADSIIYSGDEDKGMIKSVRNAVKIWGGKFSVSYNKNWRSVIKNHKKKKFTVVHLTMFGMPVQRKIKSVRKHKKILIVIGSKKVPGEIYQLSNFNLAVANQPHSEIAALSIFLHLYFKGKELEKRFKGKLKIIPQEWGKKVLKK